MSGTPKPGTVLEIVPATGLVSGRWTFRAWSKADGAIGGHPILCNDDLQGFLITTAYVSGRFIPKVYWPVAGEEFNMLIRDPVGTATLGQTLMDKPVEEGGIRIPQVGFVVLSGPANHGKSTWGRQLIWHLWSTYGAPFAITAYEEDAKPTYQQEFRRLALGKAPKQASAEELGRADIELESAAVIILRPPLASITVDQLLANIEFAVKVYGSRVVFVDPANEIDREHDPEATGKMIQELRRLAQRYRILVIVAAHPPAEIVRRKRKEELWTLYDIEGSRHWAGRSDAGFMLWRMGDSTMLYAAKLKRFQEMGKRQLYAMSHDWHRNVLTATAVGDHLLQQAVTDNSVGEKPRANGGGGANYSAQSGGR